MVFEISEFICCNFSTVSHVQSSNKKQLTLNNRNIAHPSCVVRIVLINTIRARVTVTYTRNSLNVGISAKNLCNADFKWSDKTLLTAKINAVFFLFCNQIGKTTKIAVQLNSHCQVAAPLILS